MSFINSINKEKIISRLVGGQPKEKQETAIALLDDFFKIVAEQIQFGNRVIIKDFGSFEAEEKQLLGKDATYKVKFNPGLKLQIATKHLGERFPKGMPLPMKNAITGKVHGGKGTGKEEDIEVV